MLLTLQADTFIYLSLDKKHLFFKGFD